MALMFLFKLNYCPILVTACISLSMFLLRLLTAQEVLEFFKRTGGYGYIKMQKINESNQMLTFSLGLCVALATIKLLKQLRFNQSVNYVGLTLKRCFLELASFTCLSFIMWMSYVQIMHLIYQSHLEGYSSLIKSMESAFLIMLGKFDVSQFTISHPLLGPIIFSSYICMVLFFILNIFLM